MGFGEMGQNQIVEALVMAENSRKTKGHKIAAYKFVKPYTGALKVLIIMCVNSDGHASSWSSPTSAQIARRSFEVERSAQWYSICACLSVCLQNKKAELSQS